MTGLRCTVCNSRYLHHRFTTEDKAYCGALHKSMDNPGELVAVSLLMGVVTLLLHLLAPDFTYGRVHLRTFFLLVTGSMTFLVILLLIARPFVRIKDDEVAGDSHEFRAQRDGDFYILMTLLIILTGFGIYMTGYSILNGSGIAVIVALTMVPFLLFFALALGHTLSYRVWFDGPLLVVSLLRKEDRIDLRHLKRTGKVLKSTAYAGSIRWVELELINGHRFRYEGFNRLSPADFQRLKDEIRIRMQRISDGADSPPPLDMQLVDPVWVDMPITFQPGILQTIGNSLVGIVLMLVGVGFAVISVLLLVQGTWFYGLACLLAAIVLVLEGWKDKIRKTMSTYFRLDHSGFHFGKHGNDYSIPWSRGYKYTLDGDMLKKIWFDTENQLEDDIISFDATVYSRKHRRELLEIMNCIDRRAKKVEVLPMVEAGGYGDHLSELTN